MGGFLSLWDQACPAHRHAELFQRQEPVHRMGLGKVPVLAAQPGDRRGCGSSMAEAGWSGILFKTKVPEKCG